MSSFEIHLDDMSRDDVQMLINGHVADMHDTTPLEHAYAVDVDALRSDDISFWTAWQRDTDSDILSGCAALRQLSPKHAEIKSMRTHADHIRKGVAAALLEHIIAEARAREYSKLSLETGTGSEFIPAVKLYQKYGFQKGRAFGNYSESPYNQFYHLIL